MRPAERQRILWRLGDLILTHGDELARLETLDNGKPIAEWDAALAGQRASWQSFGPTEYAALNTQELGALGGTSWDQALALLDSTRRDLQEKIALVPEEPLTVWQPSHPFGWMMEALHHHDRHHAAAVRRWRQGVGV
jgi:hypothetical protein